MSIHRLEPAIIETTCTVIQNASYASFTVLGDASFWGRKFITTDIYIQPITYHGDHKPLRFSDVIIKSDLTYAYGFRGFISPGLDVSSSLMVNEYTPVHVSFVFDYWNTYLNYTEIMAVVNQVSLVWRIAIVGYVETVSSIANTMDITHVGGVAITDLPVKIIGTIKTQNIDLD